MRIVKILVLAGAAALLTGSLSSVAAETSPAPSAAPAAPTAPAPDAALPDAAALQRLARRALLDATGVRMHVGPVILKEKLADGSWLVDVTLEDGRKVPGRLFRNRRRFRITVDRRDLFSPEHTIKVVK